MNKILDESFSDVFDFFLPFYLNQCYAFVFFFLCLEKEKSFCSVLGKEIRILQCSYGDLRILDLVKKFFQNGFFKKLVVNVVAAGSRQY